MEAFQQKFETLKSIMEAPKIETEKAMIVIKELRLKMLKIPFLNGNDQETSNDVKVMLRTIYEYDAIVNLMIGNLASFFRTMELLKIAYHQRQELPRSPKMEILIGVYLIALLAENRTADFNVSYDAALLLLGQHPTLEYAATMYKAISDNSFATIYSLKSNPPHQLYDYITSNIINGARLSHANSIRNAYENLTTQELAQILHLDSPAEAAQFALARGWSLNADQTHIIFGKESAKPHFTQESFLGSVDYCVKVSSLA
ncbi:hypothetical protein TVAG_171960 [Trichomonas vaginalis G3]|uniref:CSN8/PSMD8/EIF3K domain-containing protein n=1 Tax=Trichomonas vaginalis (strain ATCC PRA-98 / G3) TaxID=412133 RepID=A2DEU7_TRIV3|nr:proteasome assembly [Trichomonas vaginalis G3]EAY20939.1 hypothetical protein TVAG_171960 [Trichomonas vaginalis G3]KAI5519098.1 proteasome assembly [Trichomonas vaginalis G3]|eukprot:XP_001581925.1 hypothetical protein [Trichomonas vaginalis G3]